MLKKLLQAYSINKAMLFLIFMGSILWSLTMVKSGLVYSYGMGFWGPNGHDGIWHIALSESLAKSSWQMPVFSGESIKNYHIGFDLILAFLHKITFIPVVNLYFQILPPIFAVLIGFFCYLFVYEWKKSKVQAFWSTFFVYFGGSLGFIVTYIRDKQIGGESIFWAQQGISTLINPPFALSLLTMFLGLLILQKGVSFKDKRLLILTTFIFGILIQIKVYAGILVICGLFAAGMQELVRHRKVSLIKVAVGALILSILLFSPMSGEIGQNIVFKPFWFLEGMMSTPDRLNWPKFAEAMANYKLGGVLLKLIASYSLAFLIFIVGNFGTRLISLFWFIRNGFKIINYQYIDVLVVVIIVAGIIASTFFIQSGTPWNTIQFMYYSLVFSGILAGIWLGQYLEKMEKSKLNTTLLHSAVVLVVLFTIPTTVGSLWFNYLPERPPAKISREELEALYFLRDQHEGVILTQPFDRSKALAAIDDPPRPLYLYESGAYVSAFSKKPVYLEDEVNLEITGYEWRSRRRSSEEFFSGKLSDEAFLKSNSIVYIYLIKNGMDFSINKNITKLFENSEVLIYKFN